MQGVRKITSKLDKYSLRAYAVWRAQSEPRNPWQEVVGHQQHEVPVTRRSILVRKKDENRNK